YWLSDSQYDLRGGGQVWFHRVITEVVAGDGLQSVASISIDFDPSYQRLDIHHLRVMRGDQTRTLDPALLVNTLRRERDLERAMYDGRLTAHIVTPDVRLGDVVDYAYSITGAQPIFGGRFALEAAFQWGCWVGETRERIVVDAGRDLVIQPWGEPPADQGRPLDGGGVEHLWVARDTPALRGEPDVPGWVRLAPRLRVADPMTWTDVADVFRAPYASPPALPDDLEAELATIAARAPTPAERVIEGLRLVQTGLRYHSVSLGDGGFVPRPVDRIWATRSGDCKDASRLLTAVLRRLGVEADPALVHTYSGHGLDQDAPTLVAFDHCITRVLCEGAVYWLDPTRYPQGGALPALTQVRYGWALPLVAEATLEAMGEDAPTPVSGSRETFALGPSAGGPSTLDVETVFRGWRADDMRRRLANEGPDELSRSYEDHYARAYGRVIVRQPLEVLDDMEGNALTLRERYELERAWEPRQGDKVAFTTLDDLFAPHLTPSRTADRRAPVDLGLPRRATSEIIVKLGKAFNIAPWDDVFEMDGVKATSRFEAAGEHSWRLTRSVTFSRRHLPADEAERYFDLREAALRSACLGLTDIPGAAKPEPFKVNWQLVFWLAWVAIIIAANLASASRSG
ncbi:transglutaminase-like enzyme, predicted cysteine protease, partial [Caulobacter sp. AP07]|uniref:DUF3857 domain-containing transglutaminase family protein n=1 Tax=Caulobacter sp. AP07 TaxID=1144304 RepID=UPI00027220DC